jgi:hypothetical protein
MFLVLASFLDCSVNCVCEHWVLLCRRAFPLCMKMIDVQHDTVYIYICTYVSLSWMVDGSNLNEINRSPYSSVGFDKGKDVDVLKKMHNF